MMARPAEPLPVGSYDLDEDILAEAAGRGCPAFKVYPWKGLALVLGRGSDPAAELRLEAVLADRVPLLRRRGGGCSVLLDPGNAVVSLAFPLSGSGRIPRAFQVALEWLLAGLGDIGLGEIRKEGISDLALGDRKVGGTCLYRKPGLVYFSATLLVRPRLDLVERYLEHPPREPEWRRGRGHGEFMGNLAGRAGLSSPRDFCRRLRPALEARLSLVT